MKTIIACLLTTILISPASVAEEKAISQINSKNSKIKSLTADVEMVVRRRATTFTLTGKMSYEKEKNFRLTNYSPEGKFMSDFGSNNSYFWFYARRINASNVFYSSYKNLSQTNLKDVLNPLWMIDSLGVGEIATRGATVQKQGDQLIVFQYKPGTRQNKIIKATIIDPDKPAIVSHQVFGSGKEFLASINILSFYTTNNGMYIPKTLRIKSADDDAIVTWTVSNIKFNFPIDPTNWKMPNLGMKVVDLGSGVRVKNVND